MSPRHPFAWLPAYVQKPVFIVLAVAAVLLMAVLQVLGAPLKTDAAPAGIVSFEVAGDLTSTQTILRSWAGTGQVYAGLQLGLDFLFIVAYTGAIALGCALCAQALQDRGWRFAPLGLLLAWALFIAGLLDCIENYALIQLLVGSQNALLPLVAQWCAIPKFAIVAAGLVYVVAAGLAFAFITITKKQLFSAKMR